jgi:hypothetical protein
MARTLADLGAAERVEVMPGRSALRRFDASRVRIEVLTLQPRTLAILRSEASTARPGLRGLAVL